jgi:hypothetical protein
MPGLSSVNQLGVRAMTNTLDKYELAEVQLEAIMNAAADMALLPDAAWIAEDVELEVNGTTARADVCHEDVGQLTVTWRTNAHPFADAVIKDESGDTVMVRCQ